MTNEFTKEEIVIENQLEFHGRFREFILSGCKKFSIRIGKRKFTRNITVFGFRAVVNNQYSCLLQEVPFTLFQNEGWVNIMQVLTGLRKIYPEINLVSTVTVVEFRLEIPPIKVGGK